jgi:hypothetical protein
LEFLPESPLILQNLILVAEGHPIGTIEGHCARACDRRIGLRRGERRNTRRALRSLGDEMVWTDLGTVDPTALPHGPAVGSRIGILGND